MDPVNSSSRPLRSAPGRAFRYSKKPLPLRGLPQPLHVAGVEAQDQVVLHPARRVEGDDRCVGCVSQGPGAVHHGPERRVDVQALVDAQTGLAESGEAVSLGFGSLDRLAVILQRFTCSETGLVGSILANWAETYRFLIELRIDLTHTLYTTPYSGCRGTCGTCSSRRTPDGDRPGHHRRTTAQGGGTGMFDLNGASRKMGRLLRTSVPSAPSLARIPLSFPLASLALLALLIAVLAAPSGAQAQEGDPPSNHNLVNLKAEAGHEKVTLTWDAASDEEKAKITRYEVQQAESISAETAWTSIPNSDNGTTTHTVTGLTNGTTYEFRIRAAGRWRQRSPFTNSAGNAAAWIGDRGHHLEPHERRHLPRGRDNSGHRHFRRGGECDRHPLPASQRWRLRYSARRLRQGECKFAIVFEYTVVARDRDTDGVSIPRNPIVRVSADGALATIRSTAGTDVNPNHPGLPDQSGHKVDGSTTPPAAPPGAGPTITAMSITSSPASDQTYKANERS